MSKIPPHFSTNKEYLVVLEELKYYHQEPLGLTNYVRPSNSDMVYPKQNNLQIALLIRILEKLEYLETRINDLERSKQKAKFKFESKLDKVTEKS